MTIFTQTIGWIGTLLIVAGYFLVSNEKITGTGKTYQLLNLFGAIGVGANVFYQQAWPALALQVAWSIIAVSALISMRKRKGEM